MTRQKMIKKLEEIKEKIDWDSDDELTDYARERAYVCIQQAIEFLSENEEYKKMTEQEAIEEAKNVLVSRFGAVVPALEERDDDPTCDVVDDYTIGFATYLMQKRRDEVARMQAEIKRLKKENACLLKTCEGKFTFSTTQNRKYSIFNTVRKELIDRIKVLIFQKGNPYDVPFEEFVKANVFCGYLDELLKEYEK